MGAFDILGIQMPSLTTSTTDVTDPKVPYTGLAGRSYTSYTGIGSKRYGDSTANQSNLPQLDGKSWWDNAKDTLSNRDLMTGIAGAGQLGLGLANYMAMKPVYEEQLKSMQQNREIAKANYDQRQRQAQEFSNAARPIG